MTQHTDQMQISLLGPLEVRRQDGSSVAASEWRTGKTRDLLRILALDAGRPVRTATLIDRLWPDSVPERARGSLRTATSQIRHAVHTDCVARRPEALLLRDASVDAAEFLQACHRASIAARSRRHSRVLAIAYAADRLYVDDFHATDDESGWAIAERERLAHAHVEMLCDAASAAYALRRYRESLEFASTAVRSNRSVETGHRLVMQAHAALGDVGSALQAFEACRWHLAEELGADPSPQTQRLHLQLLRGDSA